MANEKQTGTNDTRTEAELKILKDLDAANDRIKVLETGVGSLTEERDSLQGQLKKAAEAADKIIAELQEDNRDLKSQVAKLLETPDKDEKKGGVGETFKSGDDEYVVLVPALRIPGHGRMSALEILASPEAQEVLVKMKSGAIRKVE
jgi:chromosome segregation ATPase